MKNSDVTCSDCGAGFQRLELDSLSSTKGEYRCPACGEVLETFNGDGALVVYREPCTRAARL